MSRGAGKYDKECTQAREAAGALGVALIVYQGRFGDGFAVQVPPAFLLQLPAALRFMANSIERDVAPPDGINRL